MSTKYISLLTLLLAVIITCSCDALFRECANGGRFDEGACSCLNGFSSNMTVHMIGCTVPPCVHGRVKNEGTCECKAGWDGVMCQICETDHSCELLDTEPRSYRCDKSPIIHGRKKQFECDILDQDVLELIGDTLSIQCDRQEQNGTNRDFFDCQLQTWNPTSQYSFEQVLSCSLFNCSAGIEPKTRHISYTCVSSMCSCVEGSLLCDEQVRNISARMVADSSISCDQTTMGCVIRHNNFPGKIDMQCTGSECIRNDTSTPIIPVRQHHLSALDFIREYIAFIMAFVTLVSMVLLTVFFLTESYIHDKRAKKEHAAIQGGAIRVETLKCETLNYYIDEHSAMTNDQAYRLRKQSGIFSTLSQLAVCCCSSQKRKGYIQMEEQTFALKEYDSQGTEIVPKPSSHKKEGDVPRHLLRGVNICIEQHRLTAILGPSGAGKSTLMDILANRKKSGVIIGDVSINDQPISCFFNRIAGYVYQCPEDDRMNPHMTTRETVRFSLDMKVGNSLTPTQKEDRVNEILTALELTHRRDTRVGSLSERGLSGGEKKRLSIACELVSFPMFLLLDEPTSGLDTPSAERLVKYLRGLCRNRSMTIVMSIHQPTEKAFGDIDVLLLLKDGKVVFHGNKPKAISFMSQYRKEGMNEDPGSTNPADYLSWCLDNFPKRVVSTQQAPKRDQENLGDILGCFTRDHTYSDDESQNSVGSSSSFFSGDIPGNKEIEVHSDCNTDDNRDRNRAVLCSEGGYLVRIAGHRHFDSISFSNEISDINVSNMCKYPTSYWYQLRRLFDRSLKNTIRDKYLLRLHLLISVVAGVGIGALFYNLGLDIAGTQSRLGGLFFICMLLCFGATSSIGSFVGERSCYMREHAAGYYSSYTYYVSKALVDALIMRILPSIITFSIAYGLMGLRPGIEYYLWYLIVIVLFNCTSGALCMLVSVVSSNVSSANLTATFLILVNSLFAGVFLNPSSIPRFLSWAKYTSYWSFTFESLLSNEIHNRILYFNPKGLRPYHANGDMWLREMYMSPDMMYLDAMILTGFLLLFHSVAALLAERCMREKK